MNSYVLSFRKSFRICESCIILFNPYFKSSLLLYHSCGMCHLAVPHVECQLWSEFWGLVVVPPSQASRCCCCMAGWDCPFRQRSTLMVFKETAWALTFTGVGCMHTLYLAWKRVIYKLGRVGSSFQGR